MHSLYVYTTPATSTHTSPTLIINKHDPGPDGAEETIGPLSDEEDINDYKEGGYHRVLVGDTFHDGRYVVEAKMGWGYFSTVWLAKDTL